jgi:Yip1 domain
MGNMSEEVKGKNPSIWGMIWSPTEQFERIKERPKIWGALAIVTVLFVIGMYLTSLGIPMEIEGISEEQLAQISMFSTITLIITGVITPIFGVLISTVIYLIIAKIARSEVSFKQLFSMSTYIMIISALSVIVNGIGIALLSGSAETIYTSLGSLIEAEGAMGGLLNSLELFTIWGVILSAIGLQKVANFSKGLAWTISIIFFAIGVIFAMIGAGLSGMVGV